jgi:hypothetical protein
LARVPIPKRDTYRGGTCPVPLLEGAPPFVFSGAECYDSRITTMSYPEPTIPTPAPTDTDGRKFKVKIPGLKVRIKRFKKGTLVRAFLILVLAGLALGLGAIFGAYVAIKDNLPDVADLETFRPKLVTTIYAADGTPVKEFAEERRVEVPYARLPKSLVEAIVATEDPRFFQHAGVDLRGILRAARSACAASSRNSGSPARSRSSTPRRRSSSSTATTSSWGTAPTASRPRPASSSARTSPILRSRNRP